MLFEMAIADAYAVAFEFAEDEAPANDLLSYHRNPAFAELEPARFTDDTHRAIANAEVILGGDGIFDPETYVRQYQEIYRRDPRYGYSRRYHAYLKANLDTPP